jgi:hypothetical protein
MTQKIKRHLLLEKHCIHQQAFELGCIYENLDLYTNSNLGYTFYSFEEKNIIALRTIKNRQEKNIDNSIIEAVIDSDNIPNIKIEIMKFVVELWLREYFKYKNLENKFLSIQII